MQKNYNENLVAGAAIRDDKGRRISKLFEASHPKMTVGYAKNLIMPDTPTEQEFNFRQSGGGVIEDGVAVIDKVKGNSVVWNQLVKNGNFESTAHWGDALSVSDGVCTYIAASQYSYLYQNIEFVSGHQYLLSAEIKASVDGTAYLGVFADKAAKGGIVVDINTSSFVLSQTIVSVDANEVGIAAWSDAMTLYIKNVNVFDLTQMFGAGNEPTTVEAFLSRKPKVADEYAYNEGTIVNNKVERCRTVGFNQFNPNVETEYLSVTGESGAERYVKRLKVLPGTYFIKSINNEIVYIKSVINGVYGSASRLNDNVKITLNSYGEIWVYTNTADLINSIANDICINLSDPAIDGQYFPYEEHTLDLSWVKEIKDGEGVKLFEDGMKSAGTAFDEAAKGRAIKRIGSVDLGTLEWSCYTTDGHLYFRANKMPSAMPKIDANSANTLYNLVCPKYKTATWKSIYNNKGDKLIGIYHNKKQFVVLDSAYTDAASFKAAMSGVMLYYELAEPIEVEYDEKSLTYPVVAGGTEEAIASEPSTAFRADIGYGIDAVKTILDLKARVEALEAK